MIVLVFEDNLIWSSRLVKSLRALGHTPVVRLKADPDPAGASVAILNLGSDAMDAKALVPALNAAGVFTIGHAGHKETELLQFGKEAGCSVLATNSQLTFKLESILASASQPAD